MVFIARVPIFCTVALVLVNWTDFVIVLPGYQISEEEKKVDNDGEQPDPELHARLKSAAETLGVIDDRIKVSNDRRNIFFIL
jgi:hypothetical protein